MSPLLDRIGAFFLDPPDDREPATAEPQPPGGDGAAPSAPDPRGRLGFAPSSAGHVAHRGYAPPVPPADGPLGAPARGDVAAPGAASSHREPRPAPPATARAPATCAASGSAAAASDVAAASGSAAAASDPGEVSESDPAARIGFAAVVGAPATVVPVAAACAGELRARARAAAAVLCVWRGGELPDGATTPAVRRLVARLAVAGPAATACGRVAWMALDADPVQAAEQVERCRALAGVPVVLALAGPRAPAFEPLLTGAGVAIAVLPPDADEALRALALATLPSRGAVVLPPLPPGPPRWAAMAGLARLRALKERR